MHCLERAQATPRRRRVLRAYLKALNSADWFAAYCNRIKSCVFPSLLSARKTSSFPRRRDARVEPAGANLAHRCAAT